MNKNKLGILVNIDTAIGNNNWKGANPNSIDKFSYVYIIDDKSIIHRYKRLLNNNMFGIIIMKLIKNE